MTGAQLAEDMNKEPNSFFLLVSGDRGCRGNELSHQLWEDDQVLGGSRQKATTAALSLLGAIVLSCR